VTPDTVILAEDEASLYLQATTQQVWAPRGLTPVVRVGIVARHSARCWLPIRAWNSCSFQ
jgi:hypothetical protein